MKQVDQSLSADDRRNDVEHLVQPWPVAASIGKETKEVIGAGEGIYVWDESGRKLIDGPAGMWCTNVGHRNHDIARVMYDQAMELSYNSPWYTANDPATKLARMLAGRAPGDLDHVFFTTGGSTAVESALRFVFFFNNVLGRPEKKLLVTRDGAYHGSTYLSASLNGNKSARKFMDFADDFVVRLSSPNPLHRDKDQTVDAFADSLLAEFQATIDEHGADKIAAFVGEPIMASGGVIVPPDGYYRRIAEICRANDILFIADEVVTAFGRLGHLFASHDGFGAMPDIITFAKGVTSGYFPLGGVIISARLMQGLRASKNPDAMFSHGLTYSSHPIGCAVAIKNLELLEGGILQHAQDVSEYFQNALHALEELPLVREVRGMGLMACVECVTDGLGADSERLASEVGPRIDRHCQKLGLLVRPINHMCVMSPPLVITKEQIDDMVRILREGITRTMADLEVEGIWSA
ncbi:MAG: aminotransferase [Paracoccaceae bacterium]